MNPAETPTVGRQLETQQINDALNEFLAAPLQHNFLRILGISGPGGVGKTFLLDSVLRVAGLENRGVLNIRIDASDEKLLRDFISVVDRKLAPLQLPVSTAARGQDYFPETRALIRSQRKLETKVAEELDQSSQLDSTVKKVAKTIYGFRPYIRLIPEYGDKVATALEWSERAELEKHIGPAVAALEGLNALKEQRSWFNRIRASRLERMKVDPFSALASAYQDDLRAFLVRYERSRVLRPFLPSKLKGADRLLLVIDDYEITGLALGDFLLAHLLKEFEKAPFPILAIILGRDDLHNAHPDFAHHAAPLIRNRIRLKPFTLEEGVQFLTQAGYESAEAKDLYVKAQGFPFVLSLLADFRANKDERPAVFYQQFYERTTRWMTSQQKQWLLPLCYLDVVNESTIEGMLPDANARTVMEWFSHEASVRSDDTSKFCVAPFIREMLREYHGKIIGKRKQDELTQQAKNLDDHS